ncbi:hypothetical protein [Corynebacterium sp. NML130628]|uniref:Rv2732c family membrane protein n=1 Tax=Corynebacterium sp. NML130628 TaxID=1906333 RepID=UPI0009FB10D5|nr:hypothetical protein [Corynebacterium sp. NML130628]
MKMELGPARWVLGAASIVWIIALFLPFVGDVAGWQVLTLGEGARNVDTKVTEYVFVWLGFLGVGVFTSIVVAARRFGVATVAWMISTVGLVSSLLAVWLRKSSTGVAEQFSHGPAFYLEVVAVLVVVLTYIPLFVHKTTADPAHVKNQPSEIDKDVANAQLTATRTHHAQETNPLLIDDRRANAVKRHNKTS